MAGAATVAATPPQVMTAGTDPALAAVALIALSVVGLARPNLRGR